MYGLTVLVVDAEEPSRSRLLLCLRRLGMRALGVDRTHDAVALLEALDADVVLVHNDDGDEALQPLLQKVRVVRLARAAGVDDAVVELLRVLGRPEEAAALN